MLSNTDAQQTFPLFNDIKTTSKFQRLPGEIVTTNFTFRERDERRDRHKQRTQHFGCPGGMRNPSAIKLGMMIGRIAFKALECGLLLQVYVHTLRYTTICDSYLSFLLTNRMISTSWHICNCTCVTASERRTEK